MITPLSTVYKRHAIGALPCGDGFNRDDPMLCVRYRTPPVPQSDAAITP